MYKLTNLSQTTTSLIYISQTPRPPKKQTKYMTLKIKEISGKYAPKIFNKTLNNSTKIGTITYY